MSYQQEDAKIREWHSNTNAVFTGVNMTDFSVRGSPENCIPFKDSKSEEVYSSDEKINHPQHYNTGLARCEMCNSQIECIDVVRHLPFNIGNAMKYLWRCDHKGNKVEDLKKAIWYIEDEIRKCSPTCA
jgi:uncharacterized protein DUF3310